VFKFIDDPRNPENPKRLAEAEKFRRDNPNGIVIRHTIVRHRDPQLGRYIASGIITRSS